MGVWIEISAYQNCLLMWRVTPLVGVWIEIIKQDLQSHNLFVTPLVGVWIEIGMGETFRYAGSSHSPRGSVD